MRYKERYAGMYIFSQRYEKNAPCVGRKGQGDGVPFAKKCHLGEYSIILITFLDKKPNSSALS